jgi:hypothetical protein
LASGSGNLSIPYARSHNERKILIWDIPSTLRLK